MTAARRLAALLAADVGCAEHREGRSENRANGSFPPKRSLRTYAGGLGDAPGGALRPDPERTLVASDRMARMGKVEVWRGDVRLSILCSSLYLI